MIDGKKIYLVVGQTGEYSDHAYWFVAAYLDEAAAKTHVELANSRCRELGLSNDNYVYSPTLEDSEVSFGELDPEFQNRYTGTWYILEEIDVLAHVPGVPTPS